MATERHFTTRRGTIAALGFGGVSLYALWAAYGAAPGPFDLFRAQDEPIVDEEPAADGAMAGHGMGFATDVEGFRAELDQFVSQFSQPDGSVYPQPMEMNMPSMDMPGMDMSASGMKTTDSGHATHNTQHGGGEPTDETPIDVLLLAERFYFEPAALKLDLGRTYRFRMLATDVTHGASIQFGKGARMIRLAPGAETELHMTFTRPGSFLVYCTSYCGPAHDFMQARITVA
jgi:cytochrome c oxidase subunit 2